MKRKSSVVLVLASLALFNPTVPGTETLIRSASAQGVEVFVDTDISDGPCVDADSDLSVSVGDSFQVALCVDGLDTSLAIFSVDLIYDDTVILAPEAADEGRGVDDNPDANAGATTWGEDLGEAVDCTLGFLAFPTGDKDPTAGKGNAFITCSNLVGPWPLGDSASAGALAVVGFTAVAEGTSTLTPTKVVLGDANASEIGSCVPSQDFPIPCGEAIVSVVKKGEVAPTEQAAPATSPATPVTSPEKLSTPSAAPSTSEDKGDRDWLLPVVIVSLAAAVVVVGMLSVGFLRWRRK